MISKPYQVLLFAVTSMSTLLVWRSLQPVRQPITAEVRGSIPVAAPPPAPWTRDRIKTRMDAVRNASSPADQLNACLELSEIPPEAVPDLLEQMKPEIDRDFSLVAQTLFIRWAASDGEAAADWAWKSFRSGSQWENTFSQIAATWVTRDPVAFGKWVIQAAQRKPGELNDAITLAQAEASDEPLLDSSTLRKIPAWLASESPRTAYGVICATAAGYGSVIDDVGRILTSVTAVREALLACDEAPDPDGKRSYIIKQTRLSLLRRWFELDPEDFSRSRYAKDFTIGSWEMVSSIQSRWDSWDEAERIERINHMLPMAIPGYQDDTITRMAVAWAKTDPGATVRWLDSLPPESRIAADRARITALAPRDLDGTLDWADLLPAGQRRDSIVPAYEAWTKAHPGKKPDMTGWPASRVRAWEDLDAPPSEVE